MIESPNKGEAIFSLRRIKNFFIDMTSHKKSKEGNMSLSNPNNDSVCEGSLLISEEVWNTLPIIEGVITTKEIPQDP